MQVEFLKIISFFFFCCYMQKEHLLLGFTGIRLGQPHKAKKYIYIILQNLQKL